jgi:hypothetical protein
MDAVAHDRKISAIPQKVLRPIVRDWFHTTKVGGKRRAFVKLQRLLAPSSIRQHRNSLVVISLLAYGPNIDVRCGIHPRYAQDAISVLSLLLTEDKVTSFLTLEVPPHAAARMFKRGAFAPSDVKAALHQATDHFLAADCEAMKIAAMAGRDVVLPAGSGLLLGEVIEAKVPDADALRLFYRRTRWRTRFRRLRRVTRLRACFIVTAHHRDALELLRAPRRVASGAELILTLAYHEAGHAVAGVALGFSLSRVDIYRSEVFLSGVCVLHSAPVANRRPWYAVVGAAGPVAERRWLESEGLTMADIYAGDAGCAGDWRRVRAIALAIGCAPSVLHGTAARMMREARVWPAVVALAAELADRLEQEGNALCCPPRRRWRSWRFTA